LSGMPDNPGADESQHWKSNQGGGGPCSVLVARLTTKWDVSSVRPAGRHCHYRARNAVLSTIPAISSVAAAARRSAHNPNSQLQVPSSKFQVDNPQSAIRNPQSEAEACFHKAIEIARQQQAKSLELRAVMSLSRLWQQQGKREEARKLLAEVYGWFTEGFDTADLQEAMTLLEELGGR
jgi:hypothetical protein